MEPYLTVLLPLFRRVQAREARFIVSVITEAELLIGAHKRGGAEAVERISDLLSEDGFEIIGVDRTIARRAAALRALGVGGIGLADAIIIATGLERGCDAIVGNDYDWSKLRELPFVRLDDIVSKE